jgi:DNA invertase Pin-like site-specific DNA recombinase
MNCVIYLRVSTKEQAREGHSIPAQKEACLKYIQDKGWNFVDCYVDRGESARSAHRPEPQNMLSLIKKDKSVGAVVVHKIDRLARNLEDHVAIKAILKSVGAQLVSVVENIEDSASGHLIEGIHALMAEFYSANLANEVKKGLTKKAQDGGWPGLAPTGYKNIRDERGIAKIVFDPEMSLLVKEAFELYATCEYSITRLHETMIAKGLKSNYTKRIMARSSLAELLRNKFFIGIIKYNGLEYPGSHKPLISKSLFSKVQEVFALHDKSGERLRKHPHYLRGTLYCGQCGSRLSSSLAKGKYLYFYCLGRCKGNGCKQNYIFIEHLENEMMKLYKDMQLPYEVVKELTVDLETELMQRESFNFKQQELLFKRKTKLNNEREKLLQAFLAEAIPLDLLKKEQSRITQELMGLESRQTNVSNHLTQIQQVIEMAIKMAANCYFAYQKALDQTKRLFNQTFFEKIYIKGNKVSGYKQPEIFEYLYRDKDCSDSVDLVGLAGYYLNYIIPAYKQLEKLIG